MNRSRAFLCLAILLLVIPGAVFAQGEYIWGKSSGAQVGVGAHGSHENTVYRVSLGFSILGAFDLSGHFGRHDNSGYIEDAGGGRISLWFLKEGRARRPFSLGLTTSIESQNSDPIIFSGVTVAKRIGFREKKSFLVPLLSLGMHWGVPHNARRVYYWTVYDDDRTFGGTLGLSLALPIATRSSIVLGASHTIVDDYSSTSGTVSVVFGKFGKE